MRCENRALEAESQLRRAAGEFQNERLTGIAGIAVTGGIAVHGLLAPKPKYFGETWVVDLLSWGEVSAAGAHVVLLVIGRDLD